MKRIVAALTLAIAASSGIASADDDAKGLTIEARGVCVVKPPPDGNEKLCPFWMPPGTKVALLVTEPQGGLVMFDRDSSRLASFVDDQGKDLTKTENEIAVETERDASSAFPPQPALSDDHKHCSVEVSVPDVPTKQATALRLSGKIVLKLAKEKKDFAAESVPLKVGTKINAAQSPSRSNALASRSGAARRGHLKWSWKQSRTWTVSREYSFSMRQAKRSGPRNPHGLTERENPQATLSQSCWENRRTTIP